jgi:mono/diheme cytochrome c family protein
MIRACCLVLIVIIACSLTPPAYPSPHADDAEGIAYFEKHVRPLFSQQCVSCHGPQKQKGGLRLDQPEFIAKGGESGKIIVPGKPESSLLFTAVGYQDDVLKMPPRGKLSAEQVEHLKQWIAKGAALPKVEVTASKVAATFDLAERSKHWCYQPMKRFDKLPTGFVDQYLKQEWQAKKLTPASPVTKVAWLRRVTFDLIGLPPTIAEQDAFEKDTSPEAYAKVVDALLARPEHGERWARHWLDLVRYADTMGHEFDFDISNAWRYRNYVIRALNADVPYPQFVLEHMAGDLLPSPRFILDRIDPGHRLPGAR